MGGFGCGYGSCYGYGSGSGYVYGSFYGRWQFLMGVLGQVMEEVREMVVGEGSMGDGSGYDS